MTAAPLRQLRDVRPSDSGDVGAKAASLGDLIATGIPVPDGYVLTADAALLPGTEREALLASAAAGLGGDRFAVRSSGLSEDGADRSYAGLYASVLDVPPSGLAAAFEEVLESSHADRVAAYAIGASARMAVIVQRMVDAAASGVALTADPLTGDRGTCVVTAVKGVGEPLVSGSVPGDEWEVRDGRAVARRVIDGAIDARIAASIAGLARRIASARGAPQDIEWAVDRRGTPWIVQARPMTALPPEVSWNPPVRGAFSRTFRFGEWINEPVTPLFESWLLTAMEESCHEALRRAIGQVIPRPYHVVVNGWYFYSMNWASPGAMARNLPRMLAKALRSPRTLSGILPATARHAVDPLEREWRDELQPRYRAAVAAAEASVETLPAADLPRLIDELAALAGEYFTSIAALSGTAYKLELNLAGFHRAQLRDVLGWSHLPLLAGFEPTGGSGRHAVVSLDWWHEPHAVDSGAGRRVAAVRVVEARRAAEAAAEAALSASPARLRTFRRLLADAQRAVSFREEQTQELTLPWPVLRRAVVRLGEALVARGALDSPDDIFFLTKAEALQALAGGSATRVDVAARRARRAEQARLVAPMVLGKLPPIAARMWRGFTEAMGAQASDRALVSGTPASAGRATGRVRVVRGADEFDDLQPGEILVAPLTAPAWTPLFARAAAVVTDIGSAAAHASVLAREYGIPAVVGTGDATARLRTGMRVTVDGGTGTVEAE